MGRSRRWNKPCRLGMIRLAGRRLRLGRGVKSLRLRQGTYAVWQRGSRSCDTRDIEQSAGARQKRVSGRRVGEVQKFGRLVFGLAARGRLGVDVHLSELFVALGLPSEKLLVERPGLDPGLPRRLQSPGCPTYLNDRAELKRRPD